MERNLLTIEQRDLESFVRTQLPELNLPNDPALIGMSEDLQNVERMAIDVLQHIPIGLLVVRTDTSDDRYRRQHVVDGLLRCMLLRHLFNERSEEELEDELPCISLGQLLTDDASLPRLSNLPQIFQDARRLGLAIKRAPERIEAGSIALWRLLKRPEEAPQFAALPKTQQEVWRELCDRTREYPLAIAKMSARKDKPWNAERFYRCRQSANRVVHEPSNELYTIEHRSLWSQLGGALGSAGADAAAIGDWLEVSDADIESTEWILRMIDFHLAPIGTPRQLRTIVDLFKTPGSLQSHCSKLFPVLADGLRLAHAFWIERRIGLTKPSWRLVIPLASVLHANESRMRDVEFQRCFWRMLLSIPEEESYPAQVAAALDGRFTPVVPLITTPQSFLREMLDWAPKHTDRRLRALLDYLVSPDASAMDGKFPQQIQPDGTLEHACHFLHRHAQTGQLLEIDHIVSRKQLKGFKIPRTLDESPLNKWALPKPLNAQKRAGGLSNLLGSGYFAECKLTAADFDVRLSEWTGSHGFQLPAEGGLSPLERLQNLFTSRSAFVWQRLEHLRPVDARVPSKVVSGMIVEGLRERWGG